MSTSTTTYNEAAVCVPRAGTLYDVLELILDRGMVIDIFVRVSLVGIEILKIDARIVVASVDTYLRFAEVCNRLDLNEDASSRTVPDLFAGMSRSVVTTGARRTAKSLGGRVKEAVGIDEDDDREDEYDERDEEEREKAPPRKRASGTRSRPAKKKTASKTSGRSSRHSRAA
ncbi:gas vesicle structural protein GvpA [Streptomyces sp. NBC_01808]|uniref:gas vesicle protein GvpJ n=1 Tax=Streptomyces sp. NBC_01808 TaxID=2975947 RepID=UPI002DD95D86|nr:gas vesicle protein GvpJ [Streptomyces sp. NBC_01808]WSA42078.1 gas vesicle structural protein GvpA [Streptomyces sp. NBC_01808]